MEGSKYLIEAEGLAVQAGWKTQMRSFGSCGLLRAGPSTAAGMAAAKGWQSMLVPALLVGTWGYACATPLSIVLGQCVLQPMVV